MNKKIFLLLPVIIALFMTSCGGGEESSTGNSLTSTSAVNLEDENTAVNAVEQAKPTLIIIPSDELLKRSGCITVEDAQGKSIYIRDYKKFLMVNEDSKFIISTIQAEFNKLGFPLEDLDQALKQINDKQMIDEVDGLKKDPKNILLTSVRPDIILELDYKLKIDTKSRNLNKSLTYTLKALDAYSNKSISNIQETGFGKELETNDASELMKQSLSSNISDFASQINKYFSDIIRKGREITVRITITKDVEMSLEDDCLDGEETYSDWIINYMKTHTVKGAYKLQMNTESEMFFKNVRIKTLNEDGTQYGAYDFARELKKALRKSCGVKASNKSQGLGDVHIMLKGM
jgi:hypothetical protein